MAMIPFPSIFICCVIGAVLSQTPTHENIVINQFSDTLLSCPVADCANTLWTSSIGDFLSVAGNIFPRGRTGYSINITAGYCTLIVLQATVDTTAGHINCEDVRIGLTLKSFHIYVISDGPSCSATGTGSDGYATDGQTLSYQCLMTYGGGGPSGYVDMTWLNAQGAQLTDALRPTAQNKLFSNFSVVAVKQSVSQYTCRSSFGNKNLSSATIITKNCVVNPIDIRYAVTYVKLSREGHNFVPGTNITCTADGVPPPTYRWVDSTTGATYVSGSNILVNNASLAWYHCEASNSLNAAHLKSGSIMFNSLNSDESTDALAGQAFHINLVIVSLSVIISVIVIVGITLCIVVKLRRVKLQRVKNDKIYDEPEYYAIPLCENITAIGENSLGMRTSSKPEKELTTSAQPGNVSVLYEEIRNSEEKNYEHLLDNRTRPGSQLNENVNENKYTALMKQSKHYQNDGRF